MSMAEVIDLEGARAGRTAAEDRLPPHDLDAEATTLSDLLLGGLEHWGRVKDFLRPEHMYSEAHRWVLTSIAAVAEAGSPIDITTVATHLKVTDRIGQVGGIAYLNDLVAASPAVANVVPHARIIHDRWRERQTIAAAQRIAGRGYLGVEDTQAYIDEAVRTLGTIARESVTTRAESNVDAIKRILASIAERSAAKTKVPLGISTGLQGYDEEWGGLHAGEVTTVVARPKVGKTSFGVQLLAHVTSQKLGVLMFSQDSPRDDMMSDLISHVAKVDSKAMRKGELDVADWRRVTEAASELGSRTFWIDDSRRIHVGQVRARALATADEWLKSSRVPLGLIIVDYIQQLAPAPGQDGKRKHEYIGHAANEIKTLARAMRVPIVVMAQQKRDYQSRPVWEASDCSEIEKECDNLFFLVKRSDTARQLRCQLVRRGVVRSLDLAFDGPSRTFSDAKFEATSRQWAKEPPPGYFDDGDDS